jgi:hypothetical protein
MRYMKPVIAAALAFSMTAAPVLAQSAAPLSVAPAMTQADEGGGYHRSYLLPAIVIIAVLAAAILLATHGDKNRPSSP